jgi:hypothetical protein
MSTRLVRFFLTSALVLVCTSFALAQYPPGDPKLGTKLGIMELNNSGEAGELALYGKDGGKRTLVVVNIEGAPHIRPQPVAIRRSNDCEKISSSEVQSLHWLVNGHSSTLVDIPILKLLVGSYSVVVGSRLLDPTHYVSCGHMYQ